MKQLILICLCLLQFMIHAQQPDDSQWLITHDGYIDGASWQPIYNSYSSVDIYNIAYPDMEVQDDNGTSSVARNHFFVIYEDGNHYNSRFAPDSYAQQNMIDYTNYVPIADIGYRVQNSTQSDIEYLYLSNIYEEDDLDAIVDGNPSAVTTTLQNYQIDYTTPSQVITANHDVVKEKDITLIFNLDLLKRNECDPSSYNLCFDIRGYDPQQTSSFTYNDIELSPVFNSESTIGMEAGSLSDNCLSINHFDFGESYAYLNLKMPLSISEYRGDDMVFTLRSTNGKCVESLKEEIRDSHDPNFMEVMCISKKCGYNIVKYHIECENESATPAQPMSMNLTLPYDFVDLNITDHLINNGNGEQGEVNESINTANNMVSFAFTQPLKGRNKKAYVEFCVKYTNVPQDFDLQTATLEPSLPRTNFAGTVYAIEEFIDIANETTVEQPAEEGEVIYTTVIERPLSNLCDCDYTYPIPCKEIILVPITPNRQRE